MDDLPEVIEQLSSRVNALEKRVAKLEDDALAGEPASSVSVPSAPPVATPVAAATFTGTFPVLGRALLGIAGAYVLRALTAGDILPRQIIAAAGILYALAWLLAAARAVPRNRIAGALYAATSALILAPMLWEMCLRFQVISAPFAAAVLALYVAAATGIAIGNQHSSAFSFAYAGGALTAVALSIGTHAMMPFTAILLAMLLVCEIAQLRSHPLAVRALIVLTTDFAAWTLLFIYRAPAGTRSDYPALSIFSVLGISCLPFFISVPGIVVRALRFHQDMTMLDIVQGVLSFVLAALALAWLLPGNGQTLLSFICLVFGLVCYAATLGPLRHSTHPLNFMVCAVWSAALLLSGVFLAFGPSVGAVAIGVAALAGILLGDRLHCMTAEFHGVLYLVIAAVVSGQLIYVRHALIGQMGHAPNWSILVVSMVAMAAYVLGDERPGEPWQSQVLHLALALLASAALAALVVRGLVALTTLVVEPAEFHIAFLRTLTLCAVALLLAFAASHWHRLELKRVAYTALAFVAAKLLFEDLRQGRMDFIAGSIFMVALTLIAVPRLAQRTPAA